MFPPVRDLLKYVLHDDCSEADTPYGRRDAGRDGKTLEYFTQHEKAKDAGLSEAHVVALRLYTTQAYAYFAHAMRELRPDGTCAEAHPLPVTMALVQARRRPQCPSTARCPSTPPTPQRAPTI